MNNINIIRHDNSVISEFYAKKSVFITGGTGYLGQVMIEKLLRSCTKLDKIYILIREKKFVSVEKRKENLIENALFKRLKENHPEYLKKIILVMGDLSKPDIGMTETDKIILIENISVVFHMAATVRFDDPIGTALQINVEGTQRILELCHQMKKLDALVHVSTAYSNNDKKIVEERVYLPPAPLEEVYAFVKENGGNKEKEAKFLISGGRPNSYTYTKALAEYEVLLGHGDIPTAIVRPSIVTPVLKEPLPGWLDNWNGMTVTLLGLVKGLIRVVPARDKNVVDLIPVDIVVNMTIVAAEKCQRTNSLTVYNCCSGPKTPITSGMILSYANQLGREYNLNDLPYPAAALTDWPILIFLIRFFAETLPAYLMDFWLRITGRSPKYLKILRKFQKAIDVHSYFTTNEWIFHDDNVTELVRTMSPQDRAVFYCDPAEIKWKPHFTDFIFGIHKYLLKK